MSWVEQKYIGLVSARLERFKRRGNVYNFRCPLCHDSEKNLRKARGYFVEVKGHFIFHCHNCGKTHKLYTFLKQIDPVLADEFKTENFINSTVPVINRKEPIEEDITHLPSIPTIGNIKGLKRMSQLDPSHPAKKYIMMRKIPSKYHFKLFYTPKFKHWVNTVSPGKFDEESLKYDEPRLIIPFLNKDNKLFGFQGRSFSKKGIRYITIMLDPDQPKVYGFDAVKTKDHINILEGPIDSMFISNSLAMAGADMQTAMKILKLNPSNCTVIMDNEPRNIQIVERIEKQISLGFNVCIWPDYIKHKDINDMVKADMKIADVEMLIKQHTFSGLAATMALSNWRRC